MRKSFKPVNDRSSKEKFDQLSNTEYDIKFLNSGFKSCNEF